MCCQDSGGRIRPSSVYESNQLVRCLHLRGRDHGRKSPISVWQSKSGMVVIRHSLLLGALLVLCVRLGRRL